jgi:hypothetical protein
MFNRCKTLLLAAGLTLSLGTVSQAALQAVGPVSLQNGFPIWFQDLAGFQVTPCLGVGCAAAPADPPKVGNPLSQQIGFGAEAFYWLASATPAGCNANLVLSMQLGWDAAGDPVVGTQTPFTRIRFRADTTVAGPHTVVTPFGTFNVTAAAGTRGINETFDVFGVRPTSVNVLTDTTFTHFFRTAAGIPAPGTAFGATGLIAAPAPAATVFSIAGLGCNTSTSEFTVGGMAFDNRANTAPIAHADVRATPVGAPVTINLTANDVDVINATTNFHGLNPKAVGLGAVAPFVFEPGTNGTPSLTTAKGGKVIKNTDGTVTYQPLATFSGIDSFPYVIQDTGGCISGQIDCSPAALGIPAPPAVAPAPQLPVSALAIVAVEQTTAKATFRPKIQKWEIKGTSSIADLKATDAAGNPVLFTNLVGAQEVPPHASAGSGDISITIRPGVDTLPGTADDLIDYTLSYAGLVAAQQAHIHSGPVGANGPPALFLCSNTAGGLIPACPAASGAVTGTLTVANLIPTAIPAGGTANATFTQLIADIMAGFTYVNVHTTAFAGGEIRGQLGRNVVAVHDGPTTASPLLGVTVVPPLVTQTSVWSLPTKMVGLPSADRTVTVQTSAGSTKTIPLKVK